MFPAEWETEELGDADRVVTTLGRILSELEPETP